MKVLVAGGSGLIGQAVLEVLLQRGFEVRQLVRTPPVDDHQLLWDPDRGELPIPAVTWADAVISLNGASLTKLPWTSAYRRQILDSRLVPTGLIARTIAAAEPKPKVWVSASAVGVYGNRPGEVLTEDSPRGSGFLADVVAKWEQATWPAVGRTRVVLARTGVVLGRGGALSPLVGLARHGLGGNIGNGRQHWPWISIDDEARAIVHLVADSQLTGPVNLTAPESATAGDLTRAVARILHRPHLVPAPAWVLRTALGEAAGELLLADQQVRPARLLGEGRFQFAHLEVSAALADVISQM